MKAKVMEKPSRLDFTPEQVEALIERLSNQCLEPGDYPFLDCMDEFLFARETAFDPSVALNFWDQNRKR